jgi:hypothetical protein
MDALVDALEHDPEKRAPHFIRAEDRFFLAANVEHVCAAIMLKQ